MPITASDALAANWVAADNVTCVPGRGIIYFQTDDGLPSTSHPMGIGYTPFGQITSIIVYVSGTVSQNLIDAGWWLQESSSSMPYVVVSLRSVTDSCSTSQLTTTMGDLITVNPVNGVSANIPLTNSDAAVAQYRIRGACISEMGRHWPMDIASQAQIQNGTASAPFMTWIFGNLAPVVPMYDDFTGIINAVFVTTQTVQQSLLSADGWDGIPLFAYLMCKNWCDSNCGWDIEFLSTMHLFFRDYKTYKCQGPCGLVNCCPSGGNSIQMRVDSPAASAPESTPVVSKSSSSSLALSLAAVTLASIAFFD